MIEVVYPFSRVLTEPKQDQWLFVSGRGGGKSRGCSDLAVTTWLSHPNSDGLMARGSYGSLEDTIYREFMGSLIRAGAGDLVAPKKMPLRIERKDGQGTVYFVGYGGYNEDRTKSFVPKHPLSFALFEETQELEKKLNFDQALASYRRRFGDGCKLFVLGNPPASRFHWFNRFVEECELDSDWAVVKSSWMDVSKFMSDEEIKEILKLKKNAREYYDWLYMGNPTGGNGKVYPMFLLDKMSFPPILMERVLDSGGAHIVAVIIGGDGAVNRDATAFVPLFLLDTGEAFVGNVFVHDPKRQTQKSYHQLVRQELSKWLDGILGKWGCTSLSDFRRGAWARVPVYMRIDSAAPDLVRECKLEFGDRVDVNSVRKGSIAEMVGVTQSALANYSIAFLDYKGVVDFERNGEFIQMPDPLMEQLDTLSWDDTGMRYDPSIPNDVSDAFTYATFFWFKNPENLSSLSVERGSGEVYNQLRERKSRSNI